MSSINTNDQSEEKTITNIDDGSKAESSVLEINESNKPQLVELPSKSTAPASKDICRDISDIIGFADAKIKSLGDATFSVVEYEAATIKLNEFRGVITAFERLLARSNAALLDEKAQLLKRLEEIQRATSVKQVEEANEMRSIPAKKKAGPRSWADDADADADDKHRHESKDVRMVIKPSRSARDASPDSDPLKDLADFDGQKRQHSHRGGIRGGRGRGRGQSIDRYGDSSDSYTRPQKIIQQGSRIPPLSESPLMLKRRITLDDIEDFVITIEPNSKYGQLIKFTIKDGEPIIVGGIIELVSDRPIHKPNICEPLYYEGMCNCATTALTLHNEKPLQIAIIDFIALLHKFITNFNGNRFHPHDVSKVRIDAIILRCVVYALKELNGTRRGRISISLSTFAEVKESRNLMDSLGEYFRNRSDEDPACIARGLFIALATHFVSS